MLGLESGMADLEFLLTSYVSNEEMHAQLADVDLDRNVSHPDYRYVIRPDTNQRRCSKWLKWSG